MEAAGADGAAAAASQPQQPPDNGQPKKGTFDSLDKPELIAKCKGLLQLAKSAKQTKDEYAAENTRLKQTIAQLQQQQTGATADLAHLAHLQASLRKLNDTVATLEQQKLLDKDYMKGMHEMVDELTNEKDTLGRRVQRLTTDNDRLLADCRQSDSILRQLNDSMTAHQQQVGQLQLMCEQQKQANEALRQQLAEATKAAQAATTPRDDSASASSSSEQLAVLRDRCRSHEAKLKLYRSRLGSFAAQLSEMRVCKEVLRTTVTEYSQSVCQWQVDILSVSKQFVERNRELSEENRRLEERLEKEGGGRGSKGEEEEGRGDDGAKAIRQLDVTLETIAAESERLQTNHRRECELLEQRCAALEAELEATSQQLPKPTAAAVSEPPPNHHAPGGPEWTKLVLERDSLIEKGQHLIEMVQELQERVQRSDADLQEQQAVSERCRQQVETIAGEHDRLKVETAQLDGKLAESQLEFDNLKKSASSDKELLATHSVKIGEQKAAIEELQGKAKQLVQLQTEFEQLQTAESDRLDELKRKNGEIEALRAQVADAQKSIDHLNSATSSSEQLSETKNIQFAELRAQISAQESEIDVLQSDSAQLTELRAEHESLQAAHTACSEDLAECREQIEYLTKQTEENQVVLETNNKRIEELCTLINVLKTDTEQLTVLRAELVQLQANHSTCSDTLAERVKEVESLKQLSEEHRLALGTDSTQIEELRAQISAQESEINVLKSDSARLKELQAEHESLHAAHSFCSKDLAECREQIENLTKQTEQNQLVLGTNDNRIEELGALINVLRTDAEHLTVLRAEHESLQATYKACHEDLAECHEKIELLTKQSEEHQLVIGTNDNRIEELCTLLSVMKTDTEQLTQLRAEHKTLQATHNACSEDLAECQKTIEHLTKQSEEHRLALSAEREETESNLHRLSELTTQNELLGTNNTRIAELLAKISDLESEIDALKTDGEQLTQLRSELESVQTNHQGCPAALAERQKEIDHLTQSSKEHLAKITKLESENEDLRSNTEQLTQLRSELELVQTNHQGCPTAIAERQKEIDHLTKDHAITIDELRAKLTAATETIQSKSLDSDASAAERSASLAEIDRLRDELATLRERCATSTSQLEHLTLERAENERQMATELAGERAAAAERVEQLLGACQKATDAVAASEAQLAAKTREMDDLLAEMRELNEALRNRGDVISKQEQRVAGLMAEVAERREAGERWQAESGRLRERVEELEAEVERVQQQQVQVQAGRGDCSYDQLSTSTISRVEEVARMRDIEDSFEEKYHKLRQLAVKLKKKCAEQQQRIDEQNTANAAAATSAAPASANPSSTTSEPAPISVASTSVSSAAKPAAAIEQQHARTLQHMQREHDRLLDELEAARAHSKTQIDQLVVRQAELEAVRSELAAAQSALEDLRCSADAGQSQRAGLDVAVREYVQQIQQLKDEVAAARQQKEASASELQSVRDQLQSREQDAEKQAAELKRLKSSLKKTNVLTLEIEAQEKSLIDISNKLTARTQQCEELQSSIELLNEGVSALKQQLRSTDSELQAEREHSAEIKIELDQQQQRHKQTEAQRADLQSRLDASQRQLADTAEQLADQRTTQAQSAGDLERSVAALQSDNQQLQQQLLAGKQLCDEVERRLRGTEQELEALRTEFVAYKVRAQSQLRHNQLQESSREAELDDELSAARTSAAQLSAKLAGVQQHAQRSEAALADQRTETERLRSAVQQLQRIADEARQNADAAQLSAASQLAEHQEQLRAVRLQSETLSTCYKQELAELREAHEKQLKQQQQLAAAQKQHNESSQIRLPGIGGHRIDQQPTPYSTDAMAQQQQQQRIDWILSERQSGEGSESTNGSAATAAAQRRRSSTNVRPSRELIPLDELLSGSGSAEATDTSANDESGGSEWFSEADLEATRHRLSMQDSRVKHLTSLLAESEQDTGRLTQLNDALKEELRRQERSAEREQHLHNLEYLKNVMFKFLTIQQGDEKAHLVPVLNTMLKLSPDETQKLQAVARGTDASQRGWGRYLPI